MHNTADALVKARIFTGYFFSIIFLQSPVTKIMFHDHLRICHLVVSVITGGGCE